MKVAGSVAIVTGASRGIGRATAQALHDRGAYVGLLARSGNELARLAETLGDRAATAVADVGDRDNLCKAIEELRRKLGPIDILVNNAGIGAYASVLEESADTYERLMRINYLGTVYATLAVVPDMTSRHRGHIVNVASLAGRLGAPFEAAYSASKFAVVGFSESLAAELHPFGISVALVNPGPVDTSFTEARGVPFQRKVPRPLRPERIAEAVVKAIEGARFEQTVPRWLRTATVMRAIAPGIYEKGLVRSSRNEAALLVRRLDGLEDGTKSTKLQ